MRNITFTSDTVCRLIGVLLIAVGGGFLWLFAYLKIRGDLAGGTRVSGILLGFGIGLILVGLMYLLSWKSPVAGDRAKEQNGWDAEKLLIRLRHPSELIAGGACL